MALSFYFALSPMRIVRLLSVSENLRALLCQAVKIPAFGSRNSHDLLHEGYHLAEAKCCEDRIKSREERGATARRPILTTKLNKI
jgi:hypothetical protein